MLDVLARQIVVMRSIIGSLQAQVDALEVVVEQMAQSEQPPVCLHENTEDAGSTLEKSRVRCLTCGAIIEEYANKGEFA